MKIGKLYIKIFFYFILTLFVAETAVFGLFYFFAGSNLDHHAERIAVAHVKLLIEALDRKLGKQNSPGSEDWNSAARYLAKIHNAEVWIVRNDGNLFGYSNQRKIPAFPRGHLKKFENFSMSWGHRGTIFAEIPYLIKGKTRAQIKMVFKKSKHGGPEELGMGLIGLALAFAILLIPVSRLISGPVRNLRDSALRIANGDIAHRAKSGRNDEIGDLSRAFNLMADRVEQMIRSTKEMSATISHEMRSPLTRMRVAEEMMRRELDELSRKRADHRYLDSIRAEIYYMDHLIGQILELSKREMGISAIEKTPADLTKMLGDTLKRYETMIRKKKLALTHNLTSEIFYICDIESMSSSFTNLFDNAVRHTPPGGAIFLNLDYYTGKNIRIVFRNTAENISNGDLVNIFNPFVRAKNTREQGFGLGLSIVRQVIANHGGTITAFIEDDYFIISIELLEK